MVSPRTLTPRVGLEKTDIKLLRHLLSAVVGVCAAVADQDRLIREGLEIAGCVAGIDLVVSSDLGDQLKQTIDS